MNSLLPSLADIQGALAHPKIIQILFNHRIDETYLICRLVKHFYRFRFVLKLPVPPAPQKMFSIYPMMVSISGRETFTKQLMRVKQERGHDTAARTRFPRVRAILRKQ